MTCSDLDRLVDDAVAGLPGAAERLAAHADACDACLAEADCAHAPVEALALLAADACPPDVIAAALAEAALPEAAALGRPPDRPAGRSTPRPDRAAVPAPRRARTVWATAVGAAVLAVAFFLAWRGVPPAPAPGARPALAEAVRPAARPAALGSDSARVVPVLTPEAPLAAVSAPRAPAPVPPGPAPEPAATPVPEPTPDSDPIDVPTFQALDPDALVAESLTPADSAAARAELLFALGIVARAQRAADAAVSDEMQRVSEALLPARLL